ncbi:MAG TPA: MFS transporter [Myxococcota bacterium]|nr:MFS transporter [Myxococcota bacterium]
MRGPALRTLSIVAMLYVVEGFPMGVYADVLPVFLRRQALSTTAIGLLSSLGVAWALKVLWSPLVDRYGERRRWITGALLAMSACLAALAAGDPLALGPALWVVLAAFCLASATQDIAIDAYTIGIVAHGDEGPANSVRVIAYRVGLIASGGALLFLPRWVGWPGTFAVAAGASIAMAFAVQACPRAPVAPAERRQTLSALRAWLGRPGAVPVLLFVLLYRVGDRAMGPMVKPFWVDRGFSDEEIGLVSNTFGVLATIAGAGLGGLVVARLGIARALLALGALALVSNFGYAGAALAVGTPRLPVYAASLVESLCSGLASVAFLSYLMRITEKEHAAVQYALLTAVYAASGSAAAAASGWGVERLGYAGWFALTAALALPAFFFLPGACAWLGEDPASEPPRASAPRPADASNPREPRPDSPPPLGR